MKKIAVFFTIFIIYTCNTSNEQNTALIDDIQDDIKQYIPVLHLQNIPIQIPIAGEMVPWKQAQIMVPFKSKIIASIVEHDMTAKKNDLLVSLWQYKQKYEYTPLNLLAPFDGIISNYNYKIGDEIPANHPILTIKNYDHYSITFGLKEGQASHLNKWAKSYISLYGKIVEGYVLNIFPQRNEAVVRFSGSDIIRTESMPVIGRIEAGMASGTFIPDRFFSERDFIQVMVEPNIELTINRIGFSDTLAFVYPGIPDQDKVKILTEGADI
jgi:hypothetical protein